MQVLTRARGENVSFIAVKIKIPEKGWPVDVNDVMHWKRARGGFWGFWKSQLVELSPASGEDGWLSLAREGLGQVSHEMGGGRWKSQNRKNVYLSPYVEEPLNSKVIKSFVPELRSRKRFRVSRFPCSMYICYEHSMYISYISGYLAMVHTINIYSALLVMWLFVSFFPSLVRCHKNIVSNCIPKYSCHILR